jgi:rSAM/selenodomain-associated transferase 1
MPDKSIILLFIKAPAKGQVKSRLAATVGDDTALALYRNFILDIVDTLKTTGYPFRVCFSPPEAEDVVKAWIGHPSVAQKGRDIGEKMEYAFSQVFFEGWHSAVLIGSDIPDLTTAVIREAFASLKKSDAVIGPAADGGYYLIGFNKSAFLPRIFHGIEWSTKSVFHETMSILLASSRRVHQLPTWSDVDTVDDLKALFARNRDTGFDKSRTMAYLIKNKLLVTMERYFKKRNHE